MTTDTLPSHHLISCITPSLPPSLPLTGQAAKQAAAEMMVPSDSNAIYYFVAFLVLAIGAAIGYIIWVNRKLHEAGYYKEKKRLSKKKVCRGSGGGSSSSSSNSSSSSCCFCCGGGIMLTSDPLTFCSSYVFSISPPFGSYRLVV